MQQETSEFKRVLMRSIFVILVFLGWPGRLSFSWHLLELLEDGRDLLFLLVGYLEAGHGRVGRPGLYIRLFLLLLGRDLIGAHWGYIL